MKSERLAGDGIALTQTQDSAFYGTINAAFDTDGETPFTVSDKEAVLSTFFDNAPLSMGVVELCDDDTDIRFLLVNRATARLFNRSPEFMANKRGKELNAPPEVLAKYVEAYLSAKQTRQPVRFETARRRVGGVTRVMEVMVSPIATDSPTERFLFTAEDTTARYEAHRKIRLMQSVVENAQAAVFITEAPAEGRGSVSATDETPHILHVNPAFELLTGFSANEAVGRTPQFLMSPVSGEVCQITAAFRECLREGKIVECETRVRHKSGGEISVELVVRPAPEGRDMGGERYCIGVLRDLSARKEAEVQLRLKDRALDAASSGIMIIDAQQDGKPIVYVNPAYEKITGLSASEVLGKPPGQMTGTTAENRGVGEAMREAMEKNQEIRFTVQNTRRDGTTLWRDIQVSPVRSEETGNVTHFIGVQNDITEQKNAEVSLILRDRAIAATSNGVIICDARLPDTPIVYCNPAFETITGYTQSEVMGRNCRFLQGPDTDETVRDEIGNALRRHRPCLVTLKNYRKNGEAFWNELSISPVRDAQNHVTHYVGVQNDVTERIAAQTALGEAESRLRYVVQNLPLVVFAINTDWVFTFSDGKGLELLGLKPGEAVGRSIQEMYPHEPVLHDRIARSLQGESITFTADVDGTIFETTYNPLRAASGKVIGIIGFALDVTERTRLETQVLQSDKLAALGQLVAGVAHELNNPLAAISGHAQLLAMHPDREVQSDARAIKTMTDRAGSVVRSLLTFAHPSKGTTEERKRHTLREMAEETLHLTRFALRKADIDVHLYFCPDEPVVLINASQIQQIILNLLTNAEHALRRAPDESDRHIIITTSVEEAGFVSLTIADNGCGIPPPIQKRIFEPFFTTKDVGEGTGLGLSICHGIAVAHNGTLHVESSEGVGAAFILRLPIAGDSRSACTDGGATASEERKLR